jgi:hypothetical protein
MRASPKSHLKAFIARPVEADAAPGAVLNRTSETAIVPRIFIQPSHCCLLFTPPHFMSGRDTACSVIN